MDLNKYIDHTLLNASATPQEIKKLCNEAKEHKFFAVCVNPCYVSLAKKELHNSEVKIAAVIGFPLGANSTETKVFEAKHAIEHGASEIDMVINIGSLKAQLYNQVENEIAAVKNAIGALTLKVIIEICYLTEDEIKKACQLSKNANANFVKTSTGFATGGATPEAVKIMFDEVGNTMQIKASGGVKDKATAIKYIEMGVSRIGTSSGIQIITSDKTSTDEHTY